jgi:acyl-CoA reductase-like NAD-dependent aldehyde dehydrogenase
MQTYPLYIGNEPVTVAAQRTIPLPFDGSPVAEVQESPAEIVDRAVAAAREGARAMAALSNGERSDLLFRLLAIVQRDLAEYARLICLETGKPIKEARGEADRTCQTLLASAIEARQLHGEAVPIDAAAIGKGRMAMTVREPVGVIAAITPFNVPFNLAMHKVGPALGSGNAVIHKPAEQTPLSALRLAEALKEAGAPKGAYSVITGAGRPLGERIVAHPAINMITFTGSVATGTWLRANCGLKKITLELGSNSALIIEPDADLDLAVQRTLLGGFSHSGQLCISVQRIYAHSSIAAQFTEALRAEVQKLKIGHPLEESTEHSSLISEAAAQRVAEWVEESVSRGAQLVTGGGRQHATVPPTILARVPEDAKVMAQEVFGPVVAVNPYDSLDQAVERVNHTTFGLQAGLFTRDLEKAFRTARRLEVGGVIINDIPTFRADHMPYGGVKQSGLGREGPKYAMEEMTEPKIIVWKS